MSNVNFNPTLILTGLKNAKKIANDIQADNIPKDSLENISSVIGDLLNADDMPSDLSSSVQALRGPRQAASTTSVLKNWFKRCASTVAEPCSLCNVQFAPARMSQLQYQASIGHR